ncbi:beta-lysine 5,6-aminomutase beta subunit [Thermoanaerobacterium sp. RBIITD]|nr:OAM dimerization domain-containing protein [Thermoanaerobacterium sp. RBIITD]SNX55016.1 beta-lysine 5,6-aminomutase beta subunit [Thermoanaerobacterium sp. RBIITD]
MSSLYSIEKKDFDKTFDIKKVKPFGDTMNDGKVQISFTLPLEDNEKSLAAAKILSEMMGVNNPDVVFHKKLDKDFTFYIIYGSLKYSVDYSNIHVEPINQVVMTMDEVDEYIRKNIKRKIVVVGASTGTDAHTVGIDAIMNMKGYAGHYGLERYKMIDAYNLGSQVENEEFVRKAIELKADVLLVSQTITQKNIHIKNLTNLVEILEADGIRDKIILICGGPRINNELAKELGYDAGFGPGTFAEDVATFAVIEMSKRKIL